MNESARALWLTPPEGASIEQVRLARRAPQELLVRSRYSAVSRGTEMLVYRGQVPASEYERMRAPFQEGILPGPVKHGYANVGVVEDGPNEWLGRTVFCLYPHQTHYVVPTHAAVPVPDNVPAARAVLAANMETAVNALWDSGPRAGDRISVVGAGVLGSLVAFLCRGLPGVAVELIDINPARRAIADALGVTFALPEAASGDRDLVFHASASEAGLNTALMLAGFASEIIELSWFGTKSPQVALGGSFHARRLSIRASQVGTVAPSRAARRSHGERLALAVALCAEPRLDVLFATEDAVFEQLPEVMARLAEPDDQTLCQRVIYPE